MNGIIYEINALGTTVFDKRKLNVYSDRFVHLDKKGGELWTVAFGNVSDIKHNALTGILVLELTDGTAKKVKTQVNPFDSKDKKMKMFAGGMVAGMQAAAEGNTWEILMPKLKGLIRN